MPGVGLSEYLEDASVPTYDSVVSAIREAALAPEVGRSLRDVPRIERRAPTVDFTLDTESLDARVVTHDIFGRSRRYRA